MRGVRVPPMRASRASRTCRFVPSHLPPSWCERYDATMQPNHPALSRDGCTSPPAPIRLHVVNIIGDMPAVSEKTKSFETSGQLILAWLDPRLDFSSVANSSCFAELRFPSIAATGGIWEPGVIVSEARTEKWGGGTGGMGAR